MNNYQVSKTRKFKKSLKNLPKDVQKQYEKALKLLQDPKYQSLKTHRYDRDQGAEIWGSYVTKKYRVFWRYHSNNTILVVGLDFH